MIDFKKEYPEYKTKNKPAIITIPEKNFIMVDGSGDPNGTQYQNAVATIYAIAYAIRMNKQIKDYYEFVVPPLEGLWWSDGAFNLNERSNWLWTSIIPMPAFVTPQVFETAVATCKLKKKEIDFSKARLEKFTEGLCVQMLHIGPYSTEPETVATMQKFMESNNLKDETGEIRKHHEVYFSDPRKAAPEKMKTILRHPIKEL